MQIGLLFGQTVVRTALVEDASTGYAGGIIRSWKSNKAVAFHVRGGQQLFSLIDSASSTAYSASVPDFYTISDFRIVGDTAYCCGSSHDTAMVAYFNINELVKIPYVGLNVILLDKLRIVTRIAAYRNRMKCGVGIAAIGEEVRKIEEHTYFQSHMIWCDNFFSSTFFCKERECDITWNLLTPSEKLSDVVVTANYVAFVGIYTNSNILCVRRGDINGIFSSSLIDTVHRYTYTFGTIESLPIAEPLEKDSLAVAVACEDVQGEHAEQIYLFDLSTMAMNNTQRIKLSEGEKVSVNELVYMRNQRKLLTAVESSDGHQIIYTNPFAYGSYYAKTLEPTTGDIICSMDRHNGSYYILSTLHHWMLQRMGAMPTSNTCVKEGYREVTLWYVNLDAPIWHKLLTNSYPTVHRRLPTTLFFTRPYCIDY